MKTIRLILLAIFTGSSTFLNAQNPSFFSSTPQYLVGSTNLTSANSIVINSVDKTRSSAQSQPLRETSTAATLLLKLDFGDDYASVPGVFNVVVNFNVLCGSNYNVANSITVNNASPEALLKIDLLGAITGATNITVNITSATIDYGGVTPSTLLSNNIQSNIRLSAILQRAYAVDVRYLNAGSTTANMANPPVVTAAPVINKRLVHFQWNSNTNDGYPNYELHVLKLENTDVTLQNDPNNISTTLDWSKALKVETQSSNPFIDLTMAEGTGFYIWRVRPIGNYFDGGIANSQNYGQWSYSVPDNTLIQLNKNSLTSGSGQPTYAFYFTDPDDDINWIYNRVFTEGDNTYQTNQTGIKVKEGMNYADGLLRSKQSQTYNSSNNTTVVSQTVSDYSGRPALTTLPVPVNGGLANYRQKFAQNSSGGVYTANDFDTDINAVNPSTINDNATDFSYYSNNASTIQNNNVPNADGYAFTRVKFKNDGTGRKEEESGVGKVHSIGSQLNGQGRTTRYYYATATDDELIRIFGDEAPLAESVIKTTVVDPNNVSSTTYTSKEGKTIATSLISDNTTNLLALNGTTSSAHTITNVADQNVVYNSSFISSKRVVIPSDQTLVTLNYNIDAAPTVGCVSGGCNYKLRLYLVDIKNGYSYESDVDGNLANGFQSFIVTQGVPFSFPSGWAFFTNDGAQKLQYNAGGSTNSQFSLNQGEYLFVKEIYATTDVGAATATVNQQQAKYKPILDAIANNMKATQNSNGVNSFSTFISNLSSLISTYQASPDNLTNNQSYTTQLLTMLGIQQGPATTSSPQYTVSADYIFPRDFNLSPIPPSQGPTSQLNITIPSSSCGGCGNLTTVVPQPNICFACEGAGTSTLQPVAQNYNDMITANAAIPYGSEYAYGINDVLEDPAYLALTNDNDRRNAIDAIVQKYFVDTLIGVIVENQLSPLDLHSIIPGFSFGLIKFMISNMLISKYYTGKAVLGSDNVTWYVAQQNPADNTWGPSTTRVADVVNSLNYDCKKLYNAWIAAIGTLNSFENSDKTRIVDHYNDDPNGGPSLS